MAGNNTVIASRAVFYALDALSKNTLIDLVADIAIAEVGVDQATDRLIMSWIQDRVAPIHRIRDQRPVDLKKRWAVKIGEIAMQRNKDN